jgi:hypothetical protein
VRGVPEVGVSASFEAYLDEVERARVDTPEHIRDGQLAYNLLTQMRPELAAVVPEVVDPFFRDDRIGPFTEWLQRNWQVAPAAP